MSDATRSVAAMNTADQYLKAIYLVQRATDGPASTGDVADQLDVSPASVNEMIGKLQTDALVEHEKYKGVDLTDEGIHRARSALTTYCIIERFMADVLGVQEFREEAQALEGVIDETVAERLDTIIDRCEQCPDCFDVEQDACEFLEVPVVADD